VPPNSLEEPFNGFPSPFFCRKARLRRWRREGAKANPSRIVSITLQGSICEKISLRPLCALSAAKFLGNEARSNPPAAPFIRLFISFLPQGAAPPLAQGGRRCWPIAVAILSLKPCKGLIRY